MDSVQKRKRYFSHPEIAYANRQAENNIESIRFVRLVTIFYLKIVLY